MKCLRKPVERAVDGTPPWILLKQLPQNYFFYVPALTKTGKREYFDFTAMNLIMLFLEGVEHYGTLDLKKKTIECSELSVMFSEILKDIGYGKIAS